MDRYKRTSHSLPEQHSDYSTLYTTLFPQIPTSDKKLAADNDNGRNNTMYKSIILRKTVKERGNADDMAALGRFNYKPVNLNSIEKDKFEKHKKDV